MNFTRQHFSIGLILFTRDIYIHSCVYEQYHIKKREGGIFVKIVQKMSNTENKINLKHFAPYSARQIFFKHINVMFTMFDKSQNSENIMNLK